jgi:serine phosphatase RsbU (regulator of sigma subunit)
MRDYKYYCTKLVLYFLLSIGFFSCNTEQKKQKEAKNGVVNISIQDFSGNNTFALQGEWFFYWKEYLRASDFERTTNARLVSVPNNWVNYEIEGKKLDAEGYATYRLLVTIPREYVNKQLLGIKTGFIPTNHELFVQNKLMNHRQKLGTSAETSQPYYDPDVHYFIPYRDTVEIIVHIANFTDRLGGMTEALLIGKAQTIRQGYENTMKVSFFLFGVLIVMACYHVSLYIFRQKTASTLWFALYCLVVAIRILVTDDYYLTDWFPNIPFEVGNKLAYLTFYMAVPLLAIFVNSLYPQEFSRYVVRFYLALGGTFSLVVLFTQGIFYSQFLVYFQLSALLIILYSIYVIFLLLRRRRNEGIIFTVGIIAIFLAAINDILFSNLIIKTANLLPMGLFVFIFSQTLILSKRFSNAFRQVENLSGELQKANEQLEITVEQRTAELNEVNVALEKNLKELQSNIALVNTQNKEIKAQNHNITASINYAKSIQNNILPDFKTIQTYFPNSFLIFKPKDIVSGDFYYFNEQGNKLILAAVDCTGHGVPGAFMSLIGYEILTEIIDHHFIMEPAQILKSLHIGVQKLLKQETSSSRDGMDVSMVVIDKSRGEIKFAGAKRPLVYIKNGKMEIIDGTNAHIGGNMMSSSFEQHTIHFEPKDKLNLYLFSDGYQDQFGGENNRKLMKRHFIELLFQIQAISMSEQGKMLMEWLETWQGEIPQTDDILVMGISL